MSRRRYPEGTLRAPRHAARSARRASSERRGDRRSAERGCVPGGLAGRSSRTTASREGRPGRCRRRSASRRSTTSSSAFAPAPALPIRASRCTPEYSNDFVDPTKCEAIARSQIARGAGAVFNVAGACGLGTLRAAQAAGVWGIGVDTDQSFLGPHILTSVTKGYEAGYAELLRQVRLGKIRAGRTTVLTLRDGGAGLGRISPKVPASLRAQLARVRERILSGEIRVPVAPRA